MFLEPQKSIPINPLQKLIGDVRNRCSHVIHMRFPSDPVGPAGGALSGSEKVGNRLKRRLASILEDVVPSIRKE